MTESAPAASPTADARLEGSYRAWAHGLAARLAAHRVAWQDDMLPTGAASSLLGAAEELPADALAPAGMGASVARWRDESVRGDRIGWVPLEPSSGSGDSPFGALHATSGWSELRAALSDVVAALNHEAAVRPGGERLRLPEKLMLAHYPRGGRYVRHSDVSAATSHRRVTVIVYLNPEWDPSRGGQLRLFLPPHSSSGRCSAPCSPPSEGETATVVAPLLGRLLLFDSTLEHEAHHTLAAPSHTTRPTPTQSPSHSPSHTLTTPPVPRHPTIPHTHHTLTTPSPHPPTPSHHHHWPTPTTQAASRDSSPPSVPSAPPSPSPLPLLRGRCASQTGRAGLSPAGSPSTPRRKGPRRRLPPTRLRRARSPPSFSSLRWRLRGRHRRRRCRRRRRRQPPPRAQRSRRPLRWRRPSFSWLRWRPPGPPRQPRRAWARHPPQRRNKPRRPPPLRPPPRCPPSLCLWRATATPRRRTPSDRSSPKRRAPRACSSASASSARSTGTRRADPHPSPVAVLALSSVA